MAPATNPSDVLSWFEQYLRRDMPLTIPEEIFSALTPEIARTVARQYGSYGLIRLPAYEIQFFEWLRTVEPSVWDDLWDGEEEPYIVSVSFLEGLLNRRRGFPICDLLTTDNYYFFPGMLEWTHQARDYTNAVHARFASGETLSTEQLLVLELSVGGAIDIWHFAYWYRIPLEEAKQAAHTLVDDKVLTHLRSAEQLAQYLR